MVDILISILSILYKIFYLFLGKWCYRVSYISRMALWKAKLSSFGKGSSIGRYVIILSPENVRLAKNVAIGDFVHIWGSGGMEIGENTIIAAHVIISTLTHDKDSLLYRDTLINKPVKIGSNVWIGGGAIILPGVFIGNDAIIGAGAVVTKDVEAKTIVVGVPAKLLSSKRDVQCFK
jgi:maltose O-acetyltransferase